MYIKQHTCRGRLLAYEVHRHIIPVSFLDSLVNADSSVDCRSSLLESCKVFDDCDQLEEDSMHKYDEYTSQPLPVINMDLAFLSLAFFSRDNLVSETETTLTIETRKYQVDMNYHLRVETNRYTLDRPRGVFSDTGLKVEHMYAQGTSIVLDVIEEIDGVSYKYNALLNLKTGTYEFVNILYNVNKPVMVMNNGNDISVVNSTTFKPLHRLVSADLKQSIDFAVGTDLGLVFALKSKITEFTFRIDFVVALEEDILLLAKVFTDEEYKVFYNKLMANGVLTLDSGNEVICDKQYTYIDFLINNVRRY